MGEDSDLRLLTAREAAALLGVSLKTFRDLGIPRVRLRRGAGHPRYTRALLSAWVQQQQETTSCPSTAPSAPGGPPAAGSRSPAKNGSSSGKVVPFGTTTSRSTEPAFAEAAGLANSKRPPPTLRVVERRSGAD